jgi:hypothetical protein
MNHHRLGVWHGMQPMTPMRMQDAGWLARTLGRGDLAPFTDADLEALALAKPTRFTTASTVSVEPRSSAAALRSRMSRR